MTTTLSPTSKPSTPNYGIDAPAVMRNLFLFGGLCLLIGLLHFNLHLGGVSIGSRGFLWPAGFLIGEGFLYLLYVKRGKFRHRDKILTLHNWRGDERVLDVGCGRGLLLAGAAKRLTTGHATGIDVWSNVDMGGNSPDATQHNLDLEGVASRATLVSVAAQDMTFPDGSFDVIVSNLCIHNIYDRPTRLAALRQIVRVLAPGGVALISDYKLTREYADYFRQAGLVVERRSGNLFKTFPPLAIVVARKA